MLIQRRRFLALAALLPCAAALAAEERRDTFQVAGLGRVIAISPTVRAGAPSGASLTVIRSVGDWRRYFLVRLAPDGPCAFVAYTDKLAHFLSQPDSPVIFEMAVPGKRSAGEVRAALDEAGLFPGEIRPCGEAKHVFTHVEWHMSGYFVDLSLQSGEYVWKRPDEIRAGFAVPTAFKAYLKLL